MFTLDDDGQTTTASSSTSEEVEEQAKLDLENDFEEVWDVRNLHHINECGPSALQHGKPVRESLSIPVPTKVGEAQQRIKKAIWAFCCFSRLEAYVKMKEADFAAAQEPLKQMKAAYEKYLAELMP